MIERDTDGGPATQVVEHTYDYLNRWVARAVDSDGDGPLGSVDTYFVYDGTPGAVSLDRAAVTTDNVGQIVLQFDDDAQGDPQLTHRYLWGDAVDEILADEQVTDLLTAGEILWPLTDHLGTVRNLAQYDAVTSTATVANHRVYDAFGRVVSETNSAVDHLFAFTGRALDESTGLQNNLNRWFDAGVGRWISQDPIGFDGGDANLSRYVGNAPERSVDPTGLAESAPRPKVEQDLIDKMEALTKAMKVKGIIIWVYKPGMSKLFDTKMVEARLREIMYGKGFKYPIHLQETNKENGDLNMGTQPSKSKYAFAVWIYWKGNKGFAQAHPYWKTVSMGEGIDETIESVDTKHEAHRAFAIVLLHEVFWHCVLGNFFDSYGAHKSDFDSTMQDCSTVPRFGDGQMRDVNSRMEGF